MNTIPLNPRLRPGSHIVRNGAGVTMRYGDAILRLHDPARADFLLKVVKLLDGRQVTDIVRELGVGSLGQLMSLLNELAQSKMIVDAGKESTLITAPQEQLNRLLPDAPAISIAVVGSGSIAQQAYSDLRDMGIKRLALLGGPGEANGVSERSCADGGVSLGPVYSLGLSDSSAYARMLSQYDLLIACASGPDLKALEQIDTAAKLNGQRWVPAFFFGDKVIVGPVVAPHDSPCFRCFELRWQGMAHFPAMERDYFNYLRDGGWKLEQPIAETVGNYIGRKAANLVIDWLNGTRAGDQLVIVDLDENETTFHSLSRHPGCPNCRQSGSMPSAASVTEDWSGWEHEKAGPLPEELIPVMETLSNHYIGIIGSELFMNDPAKADKAMELFNCAFRYAHPRPDLLCCLCGEADWSWGHSLNKDEARLLAMVEGLERYCGMSYPVYPVTAAYKDVSGHAVYPPELPLFSPGQYSRPGYPYKPFSADDPLEWTWGYDLTNGRPCLVPAAAAWYGHDSPLMGESSNGVAAHVTRHMAVYKGALELVEREGIMIFWLNKLSPPLIDHDSIKDKLVRHALADMERLGYTPYILNISTDLGIPAMLVTAIREDGKGPALLSGGGAAMDPAEAVDRAIREVYGHVKSLETTEWNQPEIKKRMEVSTPDDHYSYYSIPSRLKLADFMWAGPRRQRLEELPSLDQGEPKKNLKKLIETLRAHRLSLIAAELTTPDVAPTGLHVVRAIIPGVQPIYFGIYNRRLGGKRLYEVPCTLGYTDRPTTEDSLNPCPHFFP